MKFSYKKHNTFTRVREFLRRRTITRRVKVMRICYWGHIRRRPRNHMLRLTGNQQHINGKKKIGRPSYTDRDGMVEAFSKSTHSPTFWDNKSVNKTELKSAAERLYEESLNDSSSDDDFVISSDSEDDCIGFSS